MKSQPAWWYSQPSLKVVVIFVVLWVFGNVLLVLSTTDFFAIPFFSNVSLLILLLMMLSTFQTGKLIRNYLRTRATSK